MALLVALQAGCKKSEPEQKAGGESPQSQAQAYTNSAPGEIIARIHWLGKKRLGGDINAAPFMGIWNMPESQKLETQTLDKLALAPWDLPRSGTNLSAIIATNSSSALLRPLLGDLVEEESYLEIRQSTNQPAQAVLAIHLDDQRAALWETNLATVIQSLGGQAPTTVSGARGWNSVIENQKSKIKNTLTLSRAGPWTLLAFGDSQNALLHDFSARIQHNGAPFTLNPTNFWIDAQLDLERLAAADVTRRGPSQESASLRRRLLPTNINLTVTGDGRDVLTRAELEFPQPLPIELEPWNIPTNLIHDPLIGFSAIRGFRPWLKSFKPWTDLQLGTAPNQAYTWAQHGVPWLHFAAIPSAEASNQVDRLADFVVREVNPKIAATRLGTFERVPGTQRLKWQGVPVFSPDLNWTNVEGNSYILAGFFARSLTNQPAPPELFLQFSTSTNMIWYDWEFSKACLEGWTPISQVVRHMFNLPRFEADPGIAWLLTTAARLGNSASALKMESPMQLSFTRQSTLGFTAPELPLLLDWLESPKFPYGLHTFLAPTPEPPANPVPPREPPTNSIPRPAPQPNTNAPSELKKP